MAYLDTELNLLLAEKRYYEENPQKGKVPVSPDKILYISIKFNGDLKELEQIGFQTGNVVGNTAFGATNLAGLETLAAHPNVEMICKQRRASTTLDGSVPDIKANQVWTRSGSTFTGHTGKDVIIGIIDTGIDFRHHTFRKSDGKTRILKIWDQTLTANLDEEAPVAIADPAIGSTPLGYGVEYRDSAIDNTLEREAAGQTPITPVRHKDKDGHGTHVAGIATGDGSQSGRCHGDFTYIGVAPEASLIVVRLWGLTEGDKNRPTTLNSFKIDAISYILNEAKKAGKPVVINLSLGTFSEMMDGASPECLAIDFILIANLGGVAIVFSAGNHAQRQFHAALTVPGNTTSIENLNFKIFDKDNKRRNIVILYSGTNLGINLQVQLTSPVDGAAGKIEWVPFSDSKTSTTANGTGVILPGKVLVNNSLRRIEIQITPPVIKEAVGDDPAVFGPNKAGTWKLELKNTNTTPTPINAFCLYGNNPDSPYFKNHHVTKSTLNEFATAQQVISVGSYEVGEGLADSSARGPTLDGRVKPEFCAPGVDIASAGIHPDRREALDYICLKVCCCDCCEDFYVDKSGTSMAAPHVTGLIALMLHKNPNLTHPQIRTTIRNHTRPKPSDSTAEENEGWGSGKIDAAEAMSFVEEVNPALSAAGATELIPINPWDMLYAHFMGTERGSEFFHLFEKYSGEIRELINKNKRVATVWHRCKGPMWVRFAVRAASSPETAIPKEIGGIDFYDGLQRLIEIVKRYASRALARDIAKYESELSNLREGMNFEDMNLIDVIDSIGNSKRAVIVEPVPSSM